MATFAKKEKEKKRAKKKQDKAQKKEDRKTVNNKGKSLDELIMYIDENGNLSKTPADPRNKTEIDPSTITLGATVLPDVDAEYTGVVSFISDKGYGFIVEDNTKLNVYVNVQQLTETVKEKDKVAFEKERTPKGFSALNVRKVK